MGISPRVVMTAALNACRRYAEKFSLQSGNLLLNGKPGLGKTFLAACIARTAAERGFSVVYETAVHFFEAMDNARFHQDAARPSRPCIAMGPAICWFWTIWGRKCTLRWSIPTCTRC